MADQTINAPQGSRNQRSKAAEYLREWRARNPEKVKKHTEKRREKKNENMRTFRASHRDQQREAWREWRKTHREQKRDSNRRYYQAHKDRIQREQRLRQKKKNRSAYEKKWAKENPERASLIRFKKSRAYRARRYAAVGEFTKQEWLMLCERFDHRCAMCGKQRPLCADHIIPLARGGTNWIENIQPLCRPCNSSKGLKCPASGV